MTERKFSYSSSDGASIQDSPRSDNLLSKSSDKSIQQTIQNLQNEQERVQKKTFTKWMNTYLCQRRPPMTVDNLFEDVKDGVVLLSLLEVLSGEKLPMEKGPKLRRPHHLSNISTALNFLEKKKIKLVNINPTSVVDGKPSIVLGLIWTIILYFQIEETFPVTQTSEEEPKKKSTVPKQNLLNWAENSLTKKYGLDIKDFGKSWTDGVAFNAMIHNIRPDLVDMQEVQKQQARDNLEQAFSIAESELGIPRLLDPEDVYVDKPDEKSIMTYVAQFRKKYPQGASGVTSTNLETVEKEMKAYNSLMSWLMNEAKEILATTQEPVTDRESEFLDYLGFKTEMDTREPLFLKLGNKVLSGRALRISRPEWDKLDSSWQVVTEQANLWLQKLDSFLPGKLGQLGQWLYEAERLIRVKDQQTDSVEDMVLLYVKLLQEHEEFFQDLEEWNQFVSQVKRAGRYQDVVVHGPQFEHLFHRLESVAHLSLIRQNKLNYYLARFRLLAALAAAESKLKEWTGKSGQLEAVEHMCSDYVDFVDRQHLFEHMETALAELKRTAGVYKETGADTFEVASIDHFVDEVSARCKKTGTEIRSIRSLLDEVIAAWKRYNICLESLHVWLTEGEQVLSQKVEFIEEFFGDIASIEEHHQILNTAANFLVDVSKEPTARVIRETVALVNQRFTDLLEGFSSYRQHEVVDKARAEYEKGVTNVDSWLQATAAVMDGEVRCIHADLKAHLLLLDQYSNQIQEVESNFKMATRTAQSLVKDSSQEDVNTMLEILNLQKEAIVRLRKEIPERIKYLKAVLPNVESLETGVTDLHQWLQDGEQLLEMARLPGSPDETYTLMEKHKAFFGEVTYQKSILESKNKVYQKILATQSKLSNVDYSPVQQLMDAINQQFQDVVSSGRDWDKKLESLVRLWRSVQQKQLRLQEWLHSAHNILEDQEDDLDSLIRKHKKFFGQADNNLFEDFESSANEILQQLDPSEQGYLSENMRTLTDQWTHIMETAPFRLLILEFAIPEDKFEQAAEMAELALQEQEQQIRSNQNLAQALTKHQQMFKEGQFQSSSQQWLTEMKVLSQQLLQLRSNEHSLEQRYLSHMDRWTQLTSRIQTTHRLLKQLPERWSDYNEKLTDYQNWVRKLEKLTKDLNEGNLTGDEYKEKLAEFQKEVSQMSKYQDNLKWLQQNLDQLRQQAPQADTSQQVQALQDSQGLFQRLKPRVDSVLESAGVVTKGYDYRDKVDQRLAWLAQAQEQASDQKPIDGLEDAKASLHDTQVLLSKLEAERANIQADIEAGRRLQKDSNVPAFIHQSVSDLDRQFQETSNKVKARHAEIEKLTKDWESYEGEKAMLLTHIQKAQEELEKPVKASSYEGVQKELRSKQDLHASLASLSDNLQTMSQLHSSLAEGASSDCQVHLKGEIKDFDKKLADVAACLQGKLTDLEKSLSKWSEYNSQLSDFTDWLNRVEAELTQVADSRQGTPEEKLQMARELSSQISQGQVRLEQLEKDAKGLTQNFKSHETTAIKSKLAGLHRHWDSVNSRSQDLCRILSGTVSHSEKYQTLLGQLMPWLQKAETYCAGSVVGSSSLDQAKDVYDSNQRLLQEFEDLLPFLEDLTTEASYLTDQPQVQQELSNLQARWTRLNTDLADRSHRVDKMLTAWSDYSKGVDNFQETLDKVKAQASRSPQLNTTDVQVLEHELSLAKALQDEMGRHRPQLDELGRNFQQVKEFVSPEGLQVLQSKQDSINSYWSELNQAVTEQQKELTSALNHRKQFYQQLEDTEKWVRGMQSKLDSGREVYLDQMESTAAHLTSMRDEFQSKEQLFQSLQQELKDLVLASQDSQEGKLLSDRFDRLMQDYTGVEDVVDDRKELVDKWRHYSEADMNFQSRMAALQARLTTPGLTDEEIAEIKKEIKELHNSLQPWSQEAHALDVLMMEANMLVKDRASQKTLRFGSQLQNLQVLYDLLSGTVQQKEAKLEEVTQLSSDFVAKKENLVDDLVQVQNKLEAVKAPSSNLQGLKDVVKQLEDIRSNMQLSNPDYEHLREVARQIISADPTRADLVQRQLGQLGSDWEAAQSQLSEKEQQYQTVVNQWGQYQQAKQDLTKIVAALDQLSQEPLSFTRLEDLKQALEAHKKAELEQHRHQLQLDSVNTKGGHLLQGLSNLDGFDPTEMQGDLADVNHHWQKSAALIAQRKHNLESQLTNWEQAQSGLEEVGHWLRPELGKLEDSSVHFQDVVSLESRLNKFKEEAPHYQQVMSEVDIKLRDLQQLNLGQAVPSLASAHHDLQLHLDKANDLVEQLESRLSVFSEEEQGLYKSLQDENHWMNQLKEDLSKCDDVMGSTQQLIQRYETVKHLQEELASHQGQISAVQHKSISLQSQFPSSETSSLARESAALNHKFESLTQRADRVQNSLLAQLQQQCGEAQQQQNRWLSSVRDKMTWCQDMSADLHTVETKLATIKELESTWKEGEDKRQAAINQLDAVRGVLPQSRLAGLVASHDHMEQEWQVLVRALHQTKEQLETSRQHWQEYNQQVELFSLWLKDQEAKVRADVSLKPDLPSKKEQLQVLKDLDQTISSHTGKLEQLKNLAQQISQASGDSKALSQTGLLATRYQALVSDLKETTEKCAHNVQDHQEYLHKQKAALEWLGTARQILDKCSSGSNHEDSLNKRLTVVKELLAGRDDGFQYLNAAIEAGEKLYPATSTEGRELVRQQIRDLRDSWEQFSSQLTDLHGQLESSRTKRLSFDESFEQLSQWLQEAEVQHAAKPELKATLSEKKAQKQQIKAYVEAIKSHQALVDSVNDKGANLSSSQVQTKLKQLNSRYNQLSQLAGSQLKKWEEAVRQHQEYQESHQQSRSCLKSVHSRLEACTDLTGNRATLQGRLDRLQDLKIDLATAKAKIRLAQEHGEKTLPATALSGQSVIKQELTSLTSEWNTLATRVGQVQDQLNQSLTAMELMDGSREALHQWLRDAEARLKECELKSTLHDKEIQVSWLKSLQQEVLSKEADFVDLKNMTSQVQSSEVTLAASGSQLLTKFEALKRSTQDLIAKWEDYVQEHRRFQEDYGGCRQWLQTLKQRLHVCEQPAGDRQDVQDSIRKLEELLVERDKGAEKVSKVLTQGENLAPSTASSGREVIRQDIRNLRMDWEALCDYMTEVQHKLDMSLIQWCSYQDNFEVFHKWLLTFELELNESRSWPSSLLETRQQLQKQKMLHQDILSKQHLLDGLVEKANSLSSPTPSSKVQKFVAEFKQKYSLVCATSKKIIDKLEQSLQDYKLYEEAAHDFTDWLKAAGDKLQICADMSGDVTSLQSRRDELKELSFTTKDGEKKLNQAKKLRLKVAQSSSTAQSPIPKELDILEKEWQHYLTFLSSSHKALDQTIQHWETFQSKFDTFSHWLKDMEVRINSHELKNTLKEKQTQLDKLKTYYQDLQSHQPELDLFADDTSSLRPTSQDVRLSAQISQLTNVFQTVHSRVKELLVRWEGYVQQHAAYDDQLKDFQDWMSLAQERLTESLQLAQDPTALEQRRSLIQELTAEQVKGHHKLASLVESCERLYPDTAAPGREIIRNQLRVAKQNWEHFVSSLNDLQQRQDTDQQEWSVFQESQSQLLKWMAETEASVRAEADLKNTLEEKRSQLNIFKSLLQDVTSHQRLVESLGVKARSLAHAQGQAEFTTISSRYQKLLADVKVQVEECEAAVSSHQAYQDSLQATLHWLKVMRDKQQLCAESLGDKHSIHNKLDILHELILSMPEGASKLRECDNHIQVLMASTASQGRQTVQSELDSVHSQWQGYSNQLSTLKEVLGQAEQHWGHYETNHQRLYTWLSSVEDQLRDVPLRSSLEDKEEQLLTLQELSKEITGRQKEVDRLTEEAQALQHLTSESGVSNMVSQVTSRYQAVLTSCKALTKRGEQNVEDHKNYLRKLAECSRWLIQAKQKFSSCSQPASSRADLENKLAHVQELSNDRDAGFAALNHCLEAGEKLYPTTAPEGREVIRQELRKLKLGYESLFDDLSTVHRKLEVAMVQWSSFDESYDQVDVWLKQMEAQVLGQLVLRATLPEKKSQLLSYKATLQDILTYQRVIDNITDKAGDFLKTSSDGDLARFCNQLEQRYKKLCHHAKDLVSQYESLVSQHQQYSDLFNSSLDQLNALRKKLANCSDMSGDRQAIQYRMEVIQDTLMTKRDQESRVNDVIELSRQVLPYTAPLGQDQIIKEAEALKADWEAFILALAKTRNDLEDCLQRWMVVESLSEKSLSWLNGVEVQLQDMELEATLAQKIAQLDKNRSLQEELASHRKELDSLQAAARRLAQISTHSQVGAQATQVKAKYQATQHSLQELCNTWERHVADHQRYQQSLDKCRTSLADMRVRLGGLANLTGDRVVLTNRLAQVEILQQEKEGCMQLLQAALEQLQSVLPSTSISGRDILHKDMHALQQEFHLLVRELNQEKLAAEAALAEMTVYDHSVSQLQKWLQELLDQVSAESVLQNSLQDKRLHLDRVKVLQLNVSSQESSIDSLSNRATTMSQSTRGKNQHISQVVDQYRKLVAKVQKLLDRCEVSVRNHQAFKDVYQDAANWLSAATDKLNSSKMSGADTLTIDSHLNKIEELVSSLEAGRRKVSAAQERADTVIPDTATHGQELIREELQQLSKDFHSFESKLTDSRASLKNMQDKLFQHEKSYQELASWLQGAESNMTADISLKASLEQKISHLNRHKKALAELTEHLKAVSQLKEHASQGAMSSKWSVLADRYETCLNLSKDLMKRYQQMVLDHTDYNRAYQACKSWLQETSQRLSHGQDTGGDTHRIQRHLDELQETASSLTTGQSLLDQALALGERTVVNTNDEGKEIIQAQLQQLKSKWDHIKSKVTDTKSLMESSLGKLQDFERSRDTILSWLSETERKLLLVQPLSDLSDKRSELQRVKALYQEILSYQQQVESLVSQASLLSDQKLVSPSLAEVSSIQVRYKQVKEQAQYQLSNKERSVADHEEFQESCHKMNICLQQATQRLRDCSTLPGDKGAAETCMQTLKSLQTHLSQVNQLLSQVKDTGQATLAGSSGLGQVKVQQEIDTLCKQYEVYSQQLAQARSDLTTCLNHWRDLEQHGQELDLWLQRTELVLQTEPQLQDTLEQKKKLWHKFKALRDEVVSRQEILNQVRASQQALLQINPQSSFADFQANLAAKYSCLLTLAQERTNGMEVFYNQHRMYREDSQQLADWFNKTKLRLQKATGDRGSRQILASRLEELKKIQTELEQGQKMLDKVITSSDKTIAGTAKSGIMVIRTEVDSAKQELENIRSQVSQVQQRLEKTLAGWQEFDQAHKQMTDWMSAQEERLLADSITGSNTAASLQDYKKLQADILGHKNQLDMMEDKTSRLKDAAARIVTSDLRSRYTALVKKSQSVLDDLEVQVGSQTKFSQSYQQCQDWLTDIKGQLKQLADYSGDRPALQDRLQRLRNLKAKMKPGHEMLNHVTAQGKQLSSKTLHKNGGKLQKDLALLQADWDLLSTTITEAEKRLESSLCSVANEVQLTFSQWLQQMENRVKNCLDCQDNLTGKRGQLTRAQDLYDEILSNRSELNRIIHAADRTYQAGSTLKPGSLKGGRDTKLSSSSKRLAARYQALCNLAQKTVEQLRENMYEHRLFEEVLERANNWIHLVGLKVQACSDSSGDWHSLQDRIDDIKMEVILHMDEGLHMVNYVCDLAERMLPHTSQRGQCLIEAQTTQLTSSWERLNSDIEQCSAVLEGVQQRWHEYEELYGGLIKWLAQTEESLKPRQEFIISLTDQQNQLDWFEQMQADIENHHHLVNELAERVANLDALCDNPEVTESLAQIQDRFLVVTERSRDIVSQLKGDCDELESFYQALAECESWLLDMSRQLKVFTHSSRPSQELTVRQQDKHKLLFQEVADYQKTVDLVAGMGQQLILNYPSQPGLITQVQAHVQNLKESYHNLQSTTNQIKMTSLVSYSPSKVLSYL